MILLTLSKSPARKLERELAYEEERDLFESAGVRLIIESFSLSRSDNLWLV